MWFVGRDVAAALGYAKPENAIAAHVYECDKTTALIQGSGSNYKTKAVVINESGLYALIFGSKMESAKRFKRWVTSEVLPSNGILWLSFGYPLSVLWVSFQNIGNRSSSVFIFLSSTANSPA